MGKLAEAITKFDQALGGWLISFRQVTADLALQDALLLPAPCGDDAAFMLSVGIAP